jgi:hypothetical protein
MIRPEIEMGAIVEIDNTDPSYQLPALFFRGL